VIATIVSIIVIVVDKMKDEFNNFHSDEFPFELTFLEID